MKHESTGDKEEKKIIPNQTYQTREITNALRLNRTHNTLAIFAEERM